MRMPMTPAAPPRLSVTNGWPRPAASLSATIRATASTPPPAGNGTIKVMGRSGYLSAAAARAMSSAPRTRTAAAAMLALPMLALQCLQRMFCFRCGPDRPSPGARRGAPHYGRRLGQWPIPIWRPPFGGRLTPERRKLNPSLTVRRANRVNPLIRIAGRPVNIAAQPQQSIRFRGRSFLAFALTPEPPVADWLAELENWTRNSPGFFAGKPVILDLAAVTLSEQGIRHLIDQLLERGIRIMALEGVDPATVAPT